MTKSDFIKWVKAHGAAFRSVRNFFRSIDGDDDKRAAYATWFYALADIDIEDALAATRRMVKDFTLQPSRTEQHPAMIVNLAKRIEAVRQPEVEGCEECAGRGWIECEVKKGKRFEFPNVGCPYCAKGARFHAGTLKYLSTQQKERRPRATRSWVAAHRTDRKAPDAL